MHRPMALARSGLCRIASGRAEMLAVRSCALPLAARSYGSFGVTQPVSQYGPPLRTLPSTAFLRLAAGRLPQGCFMRAGYDILPSRRHTSSLPKRPFDVHILPQPIVDALAKPPFAYESMSPVQDAVLSLLPSLSSNEDAPTSFRIDQPHRSTEAIGIPPKDLLIQARTGTGKTVAYLIAAVAARLDFTAKIRASAALHANGRHLDKLIEAYVGKGVGALILVPTRELAMQVAKTAVSLCGTKSGLNVRLFIGGTAPSQQVHEFLALGTSDIVVATPARLLQVAQEKQQVKDRLAGTRMLVLDEADRLLEAQGVAQVNSIIDLLPEEHQTMLVSATLPQGLRDAVSQTLRPGYEIVDSSEVDSLADNAEIPQYITVAPTNFDAWLHVMRLLAHDALLHPQGGKAVLFVPSADMAALTHELLFAIRDALPWANRMHILQTSSKVGVLKREAAASIFDRGKGAYNVLVTTDLSGRGIDYTGVTRVIQLCVPPAADNYLHRIGRTARAGRTGRADMVLLPLEIEYLHDDPFRGQRAKPLTVKALEDEVMALARAQDAKVDASTIAASFTGTVDQTGARMPRCVADRLGRLADKVRTRGWSLLQERTVQHAFNSLIGYYCKKTGRLHRRMPTVVKQLVDFVHTACGYTADPIQRLPNSLRATLGLEPIEREGKLFERRVEAFKVGTESSIPSDWAKRARV